MKLKALVSSGDSISYYDINIDKLKTEYQGNLIKYLSKEVFKKYDSWILLNINLI